jgi:hypothetical protein
VSLLRNTEIFPIVVANIRPWLSPNPTEVPLDSVLAWLHRQVETVPQHLAVCEFDCRRSHCRHRDWKACTRAHPDTPLIHLTNRVPTALVTCSDA